ncbi:hypothetical protein ACTXT7_001654 [Hymenolepis weldensis]
MKAFDIDQSGKEISTRITARLDPDAVVREDYEDKIVYDLQRHVVTEGSNRKFNAISAVTLSLLNIRGKTTFMSAQSVR